MAARAATRPFNGFVADLCALYEAHRDPVAAVPMAAYMRDQFPFLGIKSPVAGPLLREALANRARPNQAELEAAATTLWALSEREYQYAAVSLLVKYSGVSEASFLPGALRFVVTKPWWDTVDALAANVVGSVVLRHPELASTIDECIQSENIWLARIAILHQLRFKGLTDAPRLFRYCVLRSDDKEFFIRKAIGWALREYSKTDAGAVRELVASNDGRLSGLSKREALLWLNGRKRAV